MAKIFFGRHLLRAIIMIALFCSFIWSQTGSSSVTGSVTDAQGNAVPGATVTLVSQQNTRRSTVTSNNGLFTLTSVVPGVYKVEVGAVGFKRSHVSAFQALVDKPTEINLRLEVGEVSETVTVDASSIENIVNTQDASLGNNFVSQQIQQLPLNARNVANLLSLQAAVTPDGSVAGGRADQANITLDGIDVNDQQTGLDFTGAAFAPVLRVNPDSVDEFRVTTSNPDASKGRSAGAQISLITKSGTNSFRGALYEYHRNTITTANDFFNNAAGVARPKLLRNLFGGRLGGPIVKDRLFFFYNYEGLKESKETSVNRVVPLASLGLGNIRFLDNLGASVTLTMAQINAMTSNGQPGGAAFVDINPAALTVLALAASRYPSNNLNVGDGLNTGGYRFNAPQPVDQNTHTFRMDWIPWGSGKHQISFRANYQQDLFGGTSRLPDTPASSRWSHPLGLAISHT